MTGLSFPLDDDLPAASGQANPISTHQVTTQVSKLLSVLEGEMSKSELMKKLYLANYKNFSTQYIQKSLEIGVIEMTKPDSPYSPTQKYRLTAKGLEYKQNLK